MQSAICMTEESVANTAPSESSMLVVTPEAALALHAALADDSESREHSIRISLDTERHMHMAMGEIRDDDKKVVFEGRIILVAEPDVASALEGQTLSIRASGARSSFVLRPNPNRAADDR